MDLAQKLTIEEVERRVHEQRTEIAAIEAAGDPIDIQFGLPVRRFALLLWEYELRRRNPAHPLPAPMTEET